MAPRAVLKLTDHRREGGTMILSYSPQQVSIGHVSVPVVKLLVCKRHKEVTSHPVPPLIM